MRGTGESYTHKEIAKYLKTSQYSRFKKKNPTTLLLGIEKERRQAIIWIYGSTHDIL